jgi:uncharacterized membrane protein
MKGQLLTYWDRVRSSFWFLPALMTAGAVVDFPPFRGH